MPEGSTDSRHLTASELSRKLNVSERTVWRWKERGAIPFVQPAGLGGAVRFPPDAVARMEDPRDANTEGQGIEKRQGKLPGRRPKWQD